MQIQLNDQVRVHFDRPRRRSENEVERPFSAMLPQREPPINMLLECRFCLVVMVEFGGNLCYLKSRYGYLNQSLYQFQVFGKCEQLKNK